MELYKKYRPTTLKDLIGQAATVTKLSALGKRGELPHTLLFTGPSGTGKTTTARILRQRMNIADVDYEELNTASDRGIGMVRELQGKMARKPFGGTHRMFVIDECQGLTTDGQDAILKTLEDTPDHVYFVLCTTDPHKLKKTILTRCTEFKFRALNAKESAQLLQTIAAAEQIQLDEEVEEAIIEAAEGSARKLLVLLHAVGGELSKEEQLAAVAAADSKRQAIELARILMFPNRRTWRDVAAILSDVDEQPEKLRWMILNYCKSVLLGGDAKKAERAFAVIDLLRENTFSSGLAGLAATCYEIMNPGE